MGGKKPFPSTQLGSPAEGLGNSTDRRCVGLSQGKYTQDGGQVIEA